MVARYWRAGLWYGLLAAVFGGLLWYRLGTLTGGYAANELATLHASSSFSEIFNHPLNAPFTLVGRLLLSLDGHGLLMMRVTAAIFGLLMLSLFYWLLRHWHGQRAAVIGTILFGSSAWFLHTARLGTPDVLLFGTLTLTACYLWLRRSQHWLVVLTSFVVVAVLLYVPGMIWVIVLGVIWQWRAIDRVFMRNLWVVSVGCLLLLGALVPLGLAIYHSPELGKVLAGLPPQGWPHIVETLQNLAAVPVTIFLHGPLDAEHWLGKLPLLDFFSMAMVVLGAYLYAKNFKLGRVYLVSGVIVIGALLISLGGAVTLTFFVPFLYILAAVGADFMLQRWFVVFPRNVFAQAAGIGLLALAIATSCWYSLRHYFVAWPDTPATKIVFAVPQQKLPSDTIKR